MLVHPQFDPIALDLTKLGLPVAIHWYGITYLVAFGLFLYLAVRRTRLPHFAAAGWTRRDVGNCSSSACSAPSSAGTRLRAFLQARYYAVNRSRFRRLEGGMAFHGGCSA